MKVITTASNIGQAFKNAGRVTEILTVFMRHGFADLLYRMKLSRFLPNKLSENQRYQNLPVAERLRRSFEELGPTFVKLGQLLASRADLLQDSFIEEFQKLQDNVVSLPFSSLKEVLVKELSVPPENIFESIETEPLAAASIAQVHAAKLKTGESVVIKIQRPGIEKIIETDISILRGLAFLLERYVPEAAALNPTGLVEEFFCTILNELDFRVEANNIRKIKANMADFPKIVVADVFSKYSTKRILVLERFEGVRFSDREKISELGINTTELVELGSDAFFSMVMRDGVFHADLHPGNLFVMPAGKIGLIDFGIVGRLSRKVQDSIIVIFTALLEEDFETLTYEYLNLCPSSALTDPVALQKDLMDAISPYVGMPLGEINVGKILISSTAIAARHHLRVPRELMLLFKAIVTIEAMGRKLDPHFDMMQTGTRLAKQVLASRYSKERIVRDLVVVGRDVQSLAESLPRLSRRFLRIWSQNQFVFQTRNQDVANLADAIRQMTNYFLASLMALGLFSVGVAFLFLDRGPKLLNEPLWSVLGFGSGFLILAYGMWNLRKK